MAISIRTACYNAIAGGTGGRSAPVPMPGVNPIIHVGNAASNNADGGTSLTVDLHASIAVGDVLLMSVTVRGGTGTTIDTPANSNSETWTLLNRTDSTTVLAQAVYWKVCTSYDVTDSGVTVTFNGATLKASGASIAFRYAVSDQPASSEYGGQANASSLTVTSPSIGSWTSDTGYSINFAGMARGANTASAPATYSNGASSSSTGGGASSRTQSHVAYKKLEGVTSNASLTETWSGTAAENIGQQVFIHQVPQETTVVEGDVLVFWAKFGSVATQPTVSTPSGWTKIAGPTNCLGGNLQQILVYWKVAGASESPTFDISWTGVDASAGTVIYAFSGADTSQPASAQVATSATASSKTHVAPYIGTWTATNGIDVVTYGQSGQNISWPMPSGYSAYGGYGNPPSDSGYGGIDNFYKAQTNVTSCASQSVTATAVSDFYGLTSHVFIKEAYGGQTVSDDFTIDALLRKTVEPTGFTLNAQITGPGFGTFVIDAIQLETIIGVVSPAPTGFYVDAQIPLPVYTFPIDAWVKPGAPPAFLAVGTSGAFSSVSGQGDWLRSTRTTTGMSGHDAAYGNGTWVIVGTGTSNDIYSSTDGINFTPRSTGLTTSVSTVAYADGYFVAGTQGTVLWSTDGITWDNQTLTGLSPNGIYHLAYGNGYWVGLESVDRYWTATTPSGTWTARDHGNGQLYAAHYSADDNVWVIGGLDSVNDVGFLKTRSGDPTGAWTSETIDFGTTPVQSVYYGNGYWVAVGYDNDFGKFATATNPTGTWTTRTLPSGWGDDCRITDVTYNPELGLWAMTSLNDGIATATDPTGTWTNEPIYGGQGYGAESITWGPPSQFGTVYLDAVIRRTQTPAGLLLDAVLRKTIEPTGFVLEAWLVETVPGSFALDAVQLDTISPTGFTLDAEKAEPFAGAFTLDAWLQYPTRTDDFTLDAEKVNASVSGSFTVAAILDAIWDSWSETFSNPIGEPSTVTGNFTLDAQLVTELFSDTFTRTVAVGLGTSTGIHPVAYSRRATLYDDPAASSVNGSAWVIASGYLETSFYGPPGPIELLVTFDFWVPADLTIGTGDNWPQYTYEPGDFPGDYREYVYVGANADGSTWFVGSPWGAENFTVTPSTMYRLKGYIHNAAGGYARYKVWKVSDPEPSAWLISTALTGHTHTGTVEPVIWITSPEAEAGYLDNLHIYTFGGLIHWIASLTVDAEITNEVRHYGDFTLYAQIGRWFTLDAAIVSRVSDRFYVEAYIARNYFTLDAVLAPGGALALDAVIVGSRSLALTLDAFIFNGTTKVKGFSADALLRKQTVYGFAASAQIVRVTVTGTGSAPVDAICLETFPASFAVDAEIIISRHRVSGFGVDADIKGALEQRGTLTLDASLVMVVGDRFYIEAMLESRQAFRLNAWLAGAITLDAELVADVPETGSLSLDAVIRPRITLDAYIATGAPRRFTLDAVILRSGSVDCWSDDFNRTETNTWGGDWTFLEARYGTAYTYTPAISDVNGSHVSFTGVRRFEPEDTYSDREFWFYETYGGYPFLSEGTVQFDFFVYTGWTPSDLPTASMRGPQGGAYRFTTAADGYTLSHQDRYNATSDTWSLHSYVYDDYEFIDPPLAHNTWYTLKLDFTSTGSDRYKVWPVGDQEPAGWVDWSHAGQVYKPTSDWHYYAPEPNDWGNWPELGFTYRPEFRIGTRWWIDWYTGQYINGVWYPAAWPWTQIIAEGALTTGIDNFSMCPPSTFAPGAITLDAVVISTTGTRAMSFKVDAYLMGLVSYGAGFTLDAMVVGSSSQAFGVAAWLAGGFSIDAFIQPYFTIDAYIRGNDTIIWPEDGGPATDSDGEPIPDWFKASRKYRVNITLDGTDVTGDVIWAQTSFTQNAKTNPGTFQIALRGVFGFNGGEVTLVSLDDWRVFGGYVLSVERSYAFSSDPGDPITILRGADFNILFDKLIVYNKASADDPQGSYRNWKSFKKNTADITIINKVLGSYVDLPAGFNYTKFVDEAGNAAPEKPWAMPTAGSPLRQVMQSISQVTSAVWWIDPYLYLHYGSRTTVTAPHSITDGLGGISSQNISMSDDMSKLVTETVLWGTLSYTVEGEIMAMKKVADSYSTFGPWQYGEFRTDLHHEAYIDRRTDSIIERYGQPIRRAKVTIFEPGYQAGQVADVRLTGHGLEAPLVIRSLLLTFAVAKEPALGNYYAVPRYELTIGLDPEEPWDIYDYLPWPDDEGTDYPPKRHRDEEDCTDHQVCDQEMFDDFTREVGNPEHSSAWWEPYGADWGYSTPMGAYWWVLGPGGSNAWVENGVGKWMHTGGDGSSGMSNLRTYDFPSLWSTDFTLTGKFHLEAVPIGSDQSPYPDLNWDPWFRVAVAGLHMPDGGYLTQELTAAMDQNGYQHLFFLGEDGILADIPYSWSHGGGQAGTWYRFKWERSLAGTRHRIKLWVDGTTEPGTWLMDVVDTPTNTPNSFGMFLYSPQSPWIWDPEDAGLFQVWFDDYQFCEDDPCADPEGEVFGVVADGWNLETRLVENGRFETSARVTRGTVSVYSNGGYYLHPQIDWDYDGSDGQHFTLNYATDKVTVVYRAWIVNLRSEYAVPRLPDPSSVRHRPIPEPS